MRFRKYHGLGNDFVVLEDLERRWGDAGSLQPELVAALCDRHTGIGADGVIRIIGAAADAETERAGAVLRMDYYNADGGPAEMCGNGIRCLVVDAERNGWIVPGSHVILTGAGPLTVELHDDRRNVTVDMGVPALELHVSVDSSRGPVEGTSVSMGNPHFVIFAQSLDDDLVGGLGAELEVHPAFPDRTNVEFVNVVTPDEIAMRVWERGIGETQACGSGACAAAVASAALGRTKRAVDVRLPGGTLKLHWREDDHVWMAGPAEEVFTGEIGEAWLRERNLTPA